MMIKKKDKKKTQIDLSGHMHLNFLNECYENETSCLVFKINKQLVSFLD